MRLAVFSHVMHKLSGSDYFAYGPYIREMNLWSKHFDTVEVIAPLSRQQPGSIDLSYSLDVIYSKTLSFELTGLLKIADAFIKLPFNIYIIVSAMRRADHIHLRCPGNIGLIACVVQLFFPRKRKTAKYAGNWDPKSKQPWSYNLQKWILSNTYLTRNMQVLVYGNWEHQSANIKPFFTATYREADKIEIPVRTLNGSIKFMFAGTLSPGKRPLYAVQLIQELHSQGVDVTMEIYGDGGLKNELNEYILDNNLSDIVRLHGNKNAAEISEAYRICHFLILPSKSEGWPKVVAEAMFWGCIPASTAVSCVPDMLDYGERGILIETDLKNDSKRIMELLASESEYLKMSARAAAWSRQFTQESFELEIGKLI